MTEVSDRHVAVICGEAYSRHAGALLSSLLTHHPDNSIVVHFVPGPDVTEPSLDHLARVAADHAYDLLVHRIPPELTAGLPILGRIGEIGWYRMLLGDVLPDLDRILYLDADMIITDSLLPIFDRDLGDDVAAAVENAYLPQREFDFERLDMDPDQGYINTGVLLLNLERLRTGAAEAMFERGHQDKSLIKMAEQDVINLVFGREIQRMHPRWNCQNALYLAREGTEKVFGARAVAEAVEDPAVVHFEGPGMCKPWHYLCDHPLRHVYLEHLAKTPWKKPVYEGRTLLNMMRRYVPGVPMPRHGA